MTILKQYLKVIYLVYIARLGKDFSLPLINQLFSHIGSLCFFTLHFLSFTLVISKFTFPGWTVPQMWVMLFTFEIFTYLSFFLFWKGYNETVRDISTGSFDMIVSKPVSSLITTFFRGGGSHNLLAALLGAVFLLGSIIIFHLPVSLFSVFLYLITLLISLWTVYCITVIFISLNFKFGRLDATIGITFQIQEIYKYPSTIYPQSGLFWLLIVTLSLLTTFPTALLLSKPISPLYLWTFATLFLVSTFFCFKSWSWGLRHYSSAG